MARRFVALTRPVVEHDGARFGDADRRTGDDRVDGVERGMGQRLVDDRARDVEFQAGRHDYGCRSVQRRRDGPREISCGATGHGGAVVGDPLRGGRASRCDRRSVPPAPQPMPARRATLRPSRPGPRADRTAASTSSWALIVASRHGRPVATRSGTTRWAAGGGRGPGSSASRARAARTALGDHRASRRRERSGPRGRRRALERGHEVAHQRHGLVEVPGLDHRLPATGLRLRNLHHAAQPAQQPDRRAHGVREHPITDAGRHHCHSHVAHAPVGGPASTA